MPVCYDNGDESVRVREANSEQDMRPRSLDTNLKTHSSLESTLLASRSSVSFRF